MPSNSKRTSRQPSRRSLLAGAAVAACATALRGNSTLAQTAPDGQLKSVITHGKN